MKIKASYVELCSKHLVEGNFYQYSIIWSELGDIKLQGVPVYGLLYTISMKHLK